MKHLKYIATIATGSILFTSLSPSAFANMDIANGLVQSALGNAMSTASSIGTMDSMGSTNDENTDDENIANTDSFTVKTYEIKKGNFSIGNTDVIEIDGNLYVYGNLDVSNVDSFTVTGKLKVTGDLIVGNGDLENSGRIYVGGKKKFSNGSMKGAGAKVTADFAKYDPILRADLDKEEETKVQDMITTMRKKVEALKQEIKTATEKGDRIEPIRDKIRHEKEVFFNEMREFIQTEDMARFEKIMKEDTSATEGFLATFKRTGEPSEKLRGQIAGIIAKIPAEQREKKLTTLVTKLEGMITIMKLSEKKKLLINQVKEALQDELDALAGDDTIDSLLNGETTTGSSQASTTGTTTSTDNSTTSSTTGTTTSTTVGSGTTSTSTSGSGTTTITQ